MDILDKVVVITGAGRGIGAAMAKRFAAGCTAGVVLSDVDFEAAEEQAQTITDAGGQAIAVRADVTDPAQVTTLVTEAERMFGPIDLFCSNAGVSSGQGIEATAETWQLAWSVNVLAHVHAARAVLPAMIKRGHGYLLNTVSVAGLLTCPGDAAYSVTKHAAIGFAEWLAFTYGSAGIKVSALCPMGVRTDMLMPGIAAGHIAALAVAASGEILEPEQVAEEVVAGLAAERFLILPHPHAATDYANKAADPDSWLAGMHTKFEGLIGKETA